MKLRAAIVVVGLLLAACGTASDSGGRAVTTDLPTATPAVTDPPAADPPAADPPLTDPPAADPPAADPPVTDPPATDLPVTDPPATDPATTDPATTDPAPIVELPPPVGRVAAAQPTQGVTTVHVGWDLNRAWTPLATWNGTGWVAHDVGGPPPPEPSFASVTIASAELDDPLNGYAYAGAAEVCTDDRRGPLIEGASRDLPGNGTYAAIGIASDWNVQPRGVRRSGIDSRDYQRIGESIVSAAGVDPAGGDVVEVLRSDLDGDGVEEVFVTFEKITDGGGAPGDFVVIYARYPTAGGRVVDQPLFEYYPQAWTSHPTIGRAGILAIADLNGDGILEVVVWSKFWDSSLAEVLVYDGATSLTSVAVSGCSL